ncbi:Cell division protein SepF [Hyella patelloides LEGE 07179]|uniref:Cell division protein SepF n=1 Tax=Hyella patelloides LEGE 07179 TaxID=945734 RepID=A0A563VK72_9CYAN|nr:cell division protein SepF [Hyella patelloides]VEP11808.1 Cell division protein SepF [Hyella patelloides LEGE 07179]
MSVTNFFKKLVRPEEDDDYDYVEVGDEAESFDEEDESQFSPKNNLDTNQYRDRQKFSAKQKKSMKDNNVIEMRGINNEKTEVMVIEPKSFDDMPKVIDALRDRKSVVLNLENMDPEKAQRSVDFVAGGTYAMDGHYERVGDNIFLFAPSCVTVSNLSGLISNADDFTTARSRRPTRDSISNSLDYWSEQNVVAQ